MTTRQSHQPSGSTAALTIGAVGVVFGDIGTSPLYAIKETFHTHHGRRLAVDAASVTGVMSLVLWALVIVISVKYLFVVMRADNHGEGGILALTALVLPEKSATRTPALVLLGLFGAALLYGDGMITPAISVLSAVEGTTVVTSRFEDLVIPVSVVILVLLFSVQRKGTASVGKVFGPLMVVWFVTLGALGISHLADAPRIFRAVNPLLGIQFLMDNALTGFLALGSVFLVVTGGEALYADMGHFGRRPIRNAWYVIVIPALLLNYFGQCAMLLAHPDRIDNPLFRMAPRWGLWPLVVLATSATVVASQALISGAFSLTRQAVQLGYLPRVRIRHTSADTEGQIYVPAVNWVLLAACVALVVGFRTSTNLAAAYGLAVTATMAITTVLFYRVARETFGWPAAPTLALSSLFLVIDLGFLGANIPKVPDGGWFPLLVGLALLTVLTTWFAGRRLTAERIFQRNLALDEFLARVAEDEPIRSPGIGVYLGPDTKRTPQAMSSHLRHVGVLPATSCVIAIVVANVPRIDRQDQLEVEQLGNGFYRFVYRVGYMDDVDVPGILTTRGAELTGIEFSKATYVLGRETVRTTGAPGMARWRERLFVLMTRNAANADAYFRLPPDRTVELGVQVEL